MDVIQLMQKVDPCCETLEGTEKVKHLEMDEMKIIFEGEEIKCETIKTWNIKNVRSWVAGFIWKGLSLTSVTCLRPTQLKREIEIMYFKGG